MTRIDIPYSGQLLVSQMAAYGLAAVLEDAGSPALIGHHDSLDLSAFVETDLGLTEVTEAIRASVEQCRDVVERDIVSGKTGNNRIPVIRARATDADRARTAVRLREELLDGCETRGDWLAAGLVAGLGAPSPWLRHSQTPDRSMPAYGATELDGVLYNIGSDIVRGPLRRSLARASELDGPSFARLLATERAADPDRLLWSPDNTNVDLAFQWIASLGLTLLPVGLASAGRASTPACWHERGGQRGITLPILATPITTPRLRALLARRELTLRPLPTADRVRLRALGVTALASFRRRAGTASTGVQFSFDPATRLDL